MKRRQIGSFSQCEVAAPWRALVLGGLVLASFLAPDRVMAGEGPPAFSTTGQVFAVFASQDCNFADMQTDGGLGYTHLFVDTGGCAGGVAAHAAADISDGTATVQESGQPQPPGVALGQAAVSWSDQIQFDGLTQPSPGALPFNIAE